MLCGGLNRFAAAAGKCCKTCRLEDVKSHFECGVQCEVWCAKGKV